MRPLNSHAGRGLQKLDDAAALTRYLAERQERGFYISRFVDYRSPDGLFRKYRIVFIGGKPYACHMAIADQWMLYYLNAGMAESAAKKIEEERFMTGFDHEFAKRHHAALAGIAERVDLDYFGIDCAQTAEGSLLLFEADIAMIVHLMDSPTIFPYKVAADAQALRRFRGDAEGLCGASVGEEALRRMSDPGRPKAGPTLDPENWSELRALGHRMLDDMLDQMARLRERPVWTKLPDEVRASFREALPIQATPLDAVYRDFQERIEPYSAGNTHPAFHGLGAGRRHRHRRARRDAGRGHECQLRRPRSCGDRSRAPDRALVAPSSSVFPKARAASSSRAPRSRISSR